MAEARTSRRRLYLRIGLWSSLAIIALLSLLDHLGVFHRSALLLSAGLPGYPGDDLRLDRRMCAFDRVIDRQTIAVKDRRGELKLRLLGASDLSDRAAGYLRNRLGQRQLMLRLEAVQTRDSQGMLLGYVYLDEDCLNHELVARGMAISDHAYPHVLMNMFDQAEKAARRKKLGIWAAQEARK